MPLVPLSPGVPSDSPPRPWADRAAAHALGRAAALRADNGPCAAGGPPAPGTGGPEADAAGWHDLCARADRLLRAPAEPAAPCGPALGAALQDLHAELRARLEADTDRTLLALVQLVSTGSTHYSATHALLCCALASLAAAALASGSADERHSAGCAALTMNLSMTALQDQLAEQPGPPSAAQRSLLARHAAGSVRLLREAGVRDAHWLEAVAHHHDAVCGPLGHRSPGLRIARLLQRADLYAAMISPRRSRRAVSCAAAAQAVCSGEDGQPDEAGLLLVRVVGLYPPGSLVRRVQGDCGVVLRRSSRMHAPRVAALADDQGRPLPVAAMRASVGTDPGGVQAALAPHELPFGLPLAALLALAGEA